MEKMKIREDAGKIWGLLSMLRVISFAEIGRRLSLNVEEISLAIGWLAHENRVCIKKQEGNLYLTDGSEFGFSFG